MKNQDNNDSEKFNTNRRSFLKKTTAGIGYATLGYATLGGAALSLLSGCSGQVFDYIVVGSGPGGGPLAANLAKAGFTVALIESGLEAAEGDLLDNSTLGTYKTPGAFNGASEHQHLSWDMFVKHYTDITQASRNDNYVPDKGILYPRGNTLGGSAAHNALIWVYPHNEDFDNIAEITGDDSWKSEKMRSYFERLERCEYLEPGAEGHGFDGYISSSMFDKQLFDLSPEIKDIAFAGAEIPASFYNGNTEQEINHPAVAEGETGTYFTPMHASYNEGQQTRSSVREYLLETREKYPDKLFIISGALASKIITKNKKAFGVEYLPSPDIYEADKNYDPTESIAPFSCFARNEVIVSGGTYNTPQLLKLSGIGPAAELSKFNIDVVNDLPGVGENMQDRYEIYVTSQLNKDLDVIRQCTPGQPDDPCATAYGTGEWISYTETPYYGPYASNFVYATRIVKSSHATDSPDLFILGLPYPFTGYFPGHSQKYDSSVWTWLVLKAHNKNTAGTVKLRSANPREQPEISFNYFEDGNDYEESDIAAVLEGVKLAREYFNHPDAKQHIEKEIFPGENIQSDDELRQYIRDQSWGHHASCSAAIGSDENPMAVLDSRFRVRGMKNLRVVDASAFPLIPGFFPVASVYIISEKASDEIIKDAKHNKNINAEIDEYYRN